MEEKQCEGPCYSSVIDKNPPCPLQCGSKGCKSYKDGPKVDLRDHVIVWLYGGPSCGKTTQSTQICAKYGFTRVHVGELLKQEIASGSVRAKCLENAMERGELVPNDMVLMLLQREIEAKAATTKGFVIDGYPREERQGVMFEKNIYPASVLIFLDAQRETLTERHMGLSKVTQKRWPKEKRNDNCPTGEYQIHVFYQHHKHIVSQYPHKTVRINAEKRTAQQIFADIQKALDVVVAKKKREADARKADEAKWKALEPQAKPSVPL